MHTTATIYIVCGDGEEEKGWEMERKKGMGEAEVVWHRNLICFPLTNRICVRLKAHYSKKTALIFQLAVYFRKLWDLVKHAPARHQTDQTVSNSVA